MLFVCNLLTVIISTFFLLYNLKKMMNGKMGIMVGANFVFYVAQVVPIIFNLFSEVSHDMRIYPQMYAALLDEKTNYYYCLFVVLMFCGFRYADKKLNKYESISRYNADWGSLIKKLWRNKIIQLVIIGGMFLPILMVFFSPDPMVYTHFAYFYRFNVSSTSLVYLYHQNVMPFFMFVAFFFCMLKYFCSNKKYQFDVYLSIIISTWIEGKRSILAFSLFGILAIDFFKNMNRKDIKKLIRKTIVFLIIIVSFFAIYRGITGKNSDSSIGLLYTVYFDKSSCVKTAIYDKLYTNSILEYPGQSFLFLLTFWIPRSVWLSKPYLYCKYFTSYVMGVSYQLNWNLLVNSETEFISSFGFLGIPLLIMFMYYIAKISVKSNNRYQYFLGMLFIYMYLIFGFEVYLEVIWLVWLVLYIISKVRLKRG